jgi:DNA-binding response OmpR family regulator
MEQCILVVEADLPVRQPLADYLRECGYKVLEAVDTDEAVAILEAGVVQVDVVLCDVASAGKVDGFGLAQWIRKNAAGAKVILAGTVEKAAEQAASLCEEGPVLEKPYHHQTLIETIRRLLAKHERANRPKQ